MILNSHEASQLITHKRRTILSIPHVNVFPIMLAWPKSSCALGELKEARIVRGCYT